MAKPVRPVWETGQAGFAWTVGKNTTRGKNSKLQVIDLPIRSTDQGETLGIVGVPCGRPLAGSPVPKTHSIKRNRKSTLKNTFPWKPPKTHKSKPFRRVFWIKITMTRGTRSSYVTSNKNSSKKHPKTSPRKFQEKAPKITKKEKREEHNQALRNHAESCIHTMKGSYKVWLQPDHPSLLQDLTMKLSSESYINPKEKIGRENRKTK
jgi:hypothetical protein